MQRAPHPSLDAASTTARPTPSLRAAALAALVCAALTGCASTADKKADAAAAQRIQPPVDEPLGKLLVDLDSAITRWNALTLTANTPAQQREARLLEAVIVEQSSKRCEELVEALELGPPINRIRAAGALGFSQSARAQGPLLAALHDPHPDVVHNALTSLAILGRADTPLDEIVALLENHIDPQTRAQAAYAVRCIVAAGGEGASVTGASRRGINDTEPFVRSQCALTLGLLADAPSVPALLDLLYDPVSLVGDAAAEALVGVSRKHPEEKGRVGRGLVELYTKSDAKLKRRAKSALVRISDVNYGDDPGLWLEWAQKLP
ncbi:MAG: HEAT repeat domain-containing protein [Planctomycetes bacterium]|nr:HEAT repeat domain-containing protein [Planctomycetota bacterium]